MVFIFNVLEQQTATFWKGILLQSHVFRKVNNNIKMNRYTYCSGNYYEVDDEGAADPLMLNGIRYSQLSMYFIEPESIKQVYSDNYRMMLDIENTGNHSYKVKLPGGDINYYYYTNGLCTKVKAEHSLFSVEFILIQ